MARSSWVGVSGVWRAYGLAIGFAVAGCGRTVTVIQTASTNHSEIRVTISQQANAIVSEPGGATRVMKYGSRERKQLWNAVSTAGPLASLPASHCMKSASFGFSLFVEVNGQRSADLSCENQSDRRAAALRTEAQKAIQRAVVHS